MCVDVMVLSVPWCAYSQTAAGFLASSCVPCNRHIIDVHGDHIHTLNCAGADLQRLWLDHSSPQHSDCGEAQRQDWSRRSCQQGRPHWWRPSSQILSSTLLWCTNSEAATSLTWASTASSETTTQTGSWRERKTRTEGGEGELFNQSPGVSPTRCCVSPTQASPLEWERTAPLRPDEISGTSFDCDLTAADPMTTTLIHGQTYLTQHPRPKYPSQNPKQYQRTCKLIGTKLWNCGSHIDVGHLSSSLAYSDLRSTASRRRLVIIFLVATKHGAYAC